MAAMFYLQRAPIPALRPWIRSLWYCHAPGIAAGRERVLPNGCIQIILNLAGDSLTDCGQDGLSHGRDPGALLIGVQTSFQVVETSDMAELAGIIVRPGGFARLFRERADLFSAQSIPLDALWRDPQMIHRLREAPDPQQKLFYLEQSLLQLLREDAQRCPLTDQALHLFRREGLSVADCARSIGVSERRLSQVFREQVGIAPKPWCRIQRFQAATRALHRGTDMRWAELALSCGYYDQSHFANDFREFSGLDITTYAASRGRWQNHVAVA